MDPLMFLGVDIGKSSHYALAVDQAGATVYQSTIPNDEASVRALVEWARVEQAQVIVDQPGGTAAMLLGLCWDAGVAIGYLHGTAMARAREFYPGESKTDPKDAFVLADIGRTHPNRIAPLEPTPEARAQLALRSGYDEDLRADANRLTNRLRALLATHWPALERALGARVATPAVLALLRKYPGGPALATAGRGRIATRLRAQHAKEPDLLAERLVTATAQTVHVPGGAVAGTIIRELAAQLTAVLARRKTLKEEIEKDFFVLPEAPILQSLPGIGPRLGARIALEIGPIERFATPSQLAAYAGLGPSPRHSGTSVRGMIAHRHGNHRLKNALFQAAFASLRHERSRTYYDRKRAEGKGHTEALLCLARRRVDVLHAMLTQHTPYATQSAGTVAA